MKNYFDFKLSGSKVFPYFLSIFLAAIVYSIVNIIAAVNLNPLAPIKFVSMGVGLVYIIIVLLVMFYIYRLMITAISYKDENLKFDGNYGDYLKINIKGIVLTIITLGIYSCWYEKKLFDFFARSSSHNNIKFKFNGRAIILFAIVTILIVFIIVASFIIAFIAAKATAESKILLPIILSMVILLLMTPILYLIYRWYIDFSYGNKTIKLKDGGSVGGCFFLLGQVILVLITFGLYYPASIIRIYRYFVNRIEIRNEEGVLESVMGCESKMGQDYLFILAQMLLTLLTFCIYYPWAMCAISERMITKTYTERIEN